MDADARACSAQRRDGRACDGRALPGRTCCFAHDESRQAALRDSRARGGRGKATSARAAKLLPETLRPVLAKLIAALDGIENESLSPQQGTALASLARAIVTVMQSGALEERLAALEEKLGLRAG